jgi:hypothetical protein
MIKIIHNIIEHIYQMKSGEEKIQVEADFIELNLI